MILIIDNYDSFVFNLYQYICELGYQAEVHRADEISIEQIKKINPQCLVISPGPKRPQDAVESKNIINEFYKTLPILGVCLGHQCIGEVFGAQVVKAGRVFHGKLSQINHDNKTIFQGLPDLFSVMRYHSLIIKNENIPDILEISAITEQKEIMAVRVKGYAVEGVQFHPESILCENGKTIIDNFFKYYNVKK